MLNGVNVIRNIGKSGPHTDKQKANEQKMTLISSLAKRIEEYLIFGFKNSKRKRGESPRSYAIRINKQVAVKGTYPEQETDFEKLVVSAGNIPEPKNAAVKLNGNKLEFTWESDLEATGTDERDQVMLLVYLPKSRKAIQLVSGARRTEEFQQLQLPGAHKDYVIETYMSFIADDRSDASPSIYLGQLNWTKKNKIKSNGND